MDGIKRGKEKKFGRAEQPVSPRTDWQSVPTCGNFGESKVEIKRKVRELKQLEPSTV